MVVTVKAVPICGPPRAYEGYSVANMHHTPPQKRIFKVTGVLPGHKRKHPQQVVRYVKAFEPAYAVSRFHTNTGRVARAWKPIIVKRLPPGSRLLH